MPRKYAIISALVCTIAVVVNAFILFTGLRRIPVRSGSPSESVHDLPTNTFVSVDGMPVEGDSRAKVVLMEFSDYQCPFCAEHANTTATDIARKFVATGKVKRVFINHPLLMHPFARRLATIAICSGEQGRYWQAYRYLFAHAGESGYMIPEAVARVVGLDSAILETCIEGDRPEVKEILKRDSALADRLGFTSTPAFVLGIQDNERVSARKTIVGAQPFSIFESAIQSVLR